MGLLYSNYESNPVTVTSNSLKINAVSGTLKKKYKDSFIVNFEKNSTYEHFYFRENKPSRILKSYYSHPGYGNYDEIYDEEYYKLKEIVVLQVMLCSDNNYLVEAIDKEDYEKMFEQLVKKDER